MARRIMGMNEIETPKYRQWKAMLAITRASLSSMRRSPSAIVFSLVFPLIFILVFGFIQTGNIRLDVCISPGSDTTLSLYKDLSNSSAFRFRAESDSVSQAELLQKGRIDAVIGVHTSPNNDSIRIDILTSQASKDRAQFVRSAIIGLIDHRNAERLRLISSQMPSEIADALKKLPLPASLKVNESPGRRYKTIDFILPGQLGFSILSAGVFGTAFVFFSLRQSLVLKRFFATPVRRPSIILGEAIARLVFQLSGSLLIILIGYFAFGFTLVDGFFTVLKMLLLAAIGLVVFMGFGFVVSGIARSESTIPPIANLFTLPQFLLSATFFPVDVFPVWLQKVSAVLPLTYLNDALRKVAFEGAGMMDVLPQLGVLAIWGIAIYALAVRLFRWE
ncbi:MAG: ABC transporter permease [Bacteroidota bacterium]